MGHKNFVLRFLESRVVHDKFSNFWAKDFRITKVALFLCTIYFFRLSQGVFKLIFSPHSRSSHSKKLATFLWHAKNVKSATVFPKISLRIVGKL